jgi:hypothetical protein
MNRGIAGTKPAFKLKRGIRWSHLNDGGELKLEKLTTPKPGDTAGKPAYPNNVRGVRW